MGEVPGGTFAFGEVGPGFTKLGGSFCPGAAVGAPGAGVRAPSVAGDSAGRGVPVTFGLLPICGFTKGVGFARSLGCGFCSAMVLFSFSAFWGFTPRHPFSTSGFAIRFCTDGKRAA